MEQVFKAFLLLLLYQSLLVSAQSSYRDFSSLQSLTQSWQNKPPSWVGSDPCGSGWEGIECTNSRVTSILLASMNLVGKLISDIQLLSKLDTLDLSYNKGLTGTIPPEIGNLRKLKTLLINQCNAREIFLVIPNSKKLILVGCSFSGSIPASIGSLQQLDFLALNSNQFSGNIPPTIGNLTNINWLDLSDNQLVGPIPISKAGVLGLEKLLTAKHFHLGNNRLSGGIPAQLFSSNMSLIHVLLNNNQLTGSIPNTVGRVNSLQAVRFDGNQFSGSVPSTISNLRNLGDLYLSNNKLNGSLPDLTGMNLLAYVDLSNNTFDSSVIPSWASSLPLMTTLMLENTNLQGQIPVSLFNQPSLESVVLKGNQLNGTLDIGNANSNRLQLIDLENNTITDFTQKNMNYKVSVVLVHNRICLESQASTKRYCQEPTSSSLYSTQPNNCSPLPCSSGQISSPGCKCSYPYTGTLFSRVISFSDLGNASYYKELELSLMTAFQSQNLPVDSVSLSNPLRNPSTDYLQLSLKVFPSSSDRFNRTGVSNIAFVLSSQLLEFPNFFLPYFFIGDVYGFDADGSKKSSHTGLIVGVVVAVVIVLVLVLLAVIYAVRQRKRAKRSAELNPFVNWELNKNSGKAPQLKGARWFSLEDLKKYTNNFSEDNTVGSGGYGKVYRAVLPTGELVAIKRAAKESMQGSGEFKTEIELLSRVHHKNLVSLAGFCFDKGEQMLVYEYIPNGTLMDSLSGKSEIKMDWMRRLKVALGAARGLAYLHELADPPIIHRDIKSSNILLDEHLNAKVADFGLSKLLVDTERGHVTTQVKGTMGYLDPEYYMTQQLTEKSDVYSFGVLMLELVTARRPIEKGKYIVREVQNVMDTSKELFNLHSIIDPFINKVTPPHGLEKFVALAMRCVREYAAQRPSMAEVVKEIENIMELAGLNPTSESDPTTEEIDVEARGGKLRHPYDHKEGFSYSGPFPSTKVEPQ